MHLSACAYANMCVTSVCLQFIVHVCVAEPQTAVLISLKLIVQYVKDKYA